MKEVVTKDFLEEVAAEFPELDEAGLNKMLLYLMRQTSRLLRNGFELHYNDHRKKEEPFTMRIVNFNPNPETFNEAARKKKIRKNILRNRLKKIPKASPGQHYPVFLDNGKK